MSPIASSSTASPTNLDLYREALRRLLVANAIPAGAPDALALVADGLRSRPQFRVRLLSFFEGMLRREAEPVGALELLALLVHAARGSAGDLTDPALREPVGELLRFALEAELGSQSGASPFSGQQARRPRSFLQTGRGRAAEELPFGEDDGSISGSGNQRPSRHRVEVLIALFCIAFGLVAGLLTRGHRHLLSAPGVGQLAAAPTPVERSYSPGADVAAYGVPTPLSDEAPALASVPTTRRSPERHTAQAPERRTARPLRRDHVDTAVSQARGMEPDPRLRPGTAANGAVAAASKAVSDKSVVSAQGPARQAAILQAATFRPLGRVAESDALAKASLRATGDSATRDLSGGDMAAHTSVLAGSAGVMAANTLSTPAPAYPVQASAARVQGQVVIEAVVGRDGRVVETRLISGPPMLQAAALDAVGRWSFRPYVVDGKAAEIATTAILDFRLGR